MRHVINSRRDTRSNINASRDRRHESEMRRRKSMIEITAHQHAAARPGRNQRQPLRAALPQADRLGRGCTTRDDGRPLGTAVATTLARIVKRPGGHVESQPFPPGSGRSSGRLTSRSPDSWLTIYTTAAQAAGATEDVMMAYLPIVPGQDALRWLRHLPRHCIND
jgi:hypothetical protein